eukprot:3941427-Amphidinium_carterae.2
MFERRGFQVLRAVIGFTTPKQLAKKTTDSLFQDVDLRADIALAVLGEGPPPVAPVVVDRVACSASDALYYAHTVRGADTVYVVGSDIMAKPSDFTLVVTRKSIELGAVEALDLKLLKGVCVQKDCLDVTSTGVRAELSRLTIPRSYGVRARALIAKAVGLLGDASIREAASLQPIQTSVYKPRSTVLPDDDSSSSSDSLPVQPEPASQRDLQPLDAMPVRVVSQGNGTPYGSSVTLVPGATAKAIGKPHGSLAQRRKEVSRRQGAQGSRLIPVQVIDEDVSDDVVPQGLDVSSNCPDPALVASFRSKLLQVAADRYGVLANAHRHSFSLAAAPQAYLLDQVGTMKLHPPRLSCLCIFWEKCVLPLCSVLRVRPYLLSRRACDPFLRLSYVPAVVPQGGWRPMLMFLSTAELSEFSKALWQAAPSLACCVYAAFNLLECLPADEDADTERGGQARMDIRYALFQASRKLLLSVVHVMVVMFDAQHVIAVVRPCYNVGANDIALELIENFNAMLQQ